MKKNTLILIISLMTASYLGYSQNLDQAELEVFYQYEMIGNPQRPERKMKDETILLIGNKYTTYYSFMNYIVDSLRKANLDQYSPQLTSTGSDGSVITMRSGETTGEFAERAKAAGGVPVVHPARAKTRINAYNYEHYYIEKQSGQLICMDKVTTAMSGVIYCSYTEILEKPQWIIGTDMETVADYLCQKATTHYGGRDWTVWFTPDIPVSEGPWKLRGLPGLILKAETSDGEFAMTATSVNRSSGKPISKDQKNNYRKMSKKDLFKLKNKAFDAIAPGSYNGIEILK